MRKWWHSPFNFPILCSLRCGNGGTPPLTSLLKSVNLYFQTSYESEHTISVAPTHAHNKRRQFSLMENESKTTYNSLPRQLHRRDGVVHSSAEHFWFVVYIFTKNFILWVTSTIPVKLKMFEPKINVKLNLTTCLFWLNENPVSIPYSVKTDTLHKKVCPEILLFLSIRTFSVKIMIILTILHELFVFICILFHCSNNTPLLSCTVV